LVSPTAWKLWLGVTVDTSDVDESPLFPYYYVCAHILINPVFQLVVFWSVGDASKGVLWDCVLLLVGQFVVYLACLYAFVQTSTMNPGRIDASFPHLNEWRQLYETTLEKYASSSKPVSSLPQLCHTCHIARPLRSKHDRFTDACILVFDHHCPYVPSCHEMQLCIDSIRCVLSAPVFTEQFCWELDRAVQLQVVLRVLGNVLVVPLPALHPSGSVVETPGPS
jgi:DHHC palmitoyltransferase